MAKGKHKSKAAARQASAAAIELSAIETAQHPWWSIAPATEPRSRSAAVEAAARVARAQWDDCPAHSHWSGCLRTAAAHLNAAMLMHDSELRPLVMALLRDRSEPRWLFHELARDSFAPARDAAEELLRQAGLDSSVALDLKADALARDGSALQVDSGVLQVPRQMRPVLLRQRALTLLSGGTHDSALLTIWGQDARIWGTRPRPTAQRGP